MDPHNEFDDAARYQLATMTYAMGAAHYHRLPALRGPMKTLMRGAIHEMLHPFCWDYWYLTSQASSIFDPHLKELRRPWSDPVVKENIMYSGHLLLMTSLYAMLFDHDEFEQPGSLTFRLRHWAWGLGPEDFVYDNRKLQDVILKQMEENNWVGVCCEHNAVFVVCNQFPLIVMRYNDSRDNTDKISTILPKYKAAIRNAGMLRDDDLYTSFFALKQNKATPSRHGAHTAWANAFMSAYDSAGVASRCESQTLGFLTHFNNTTRLHPTRVAMAFRHLFLIEGHPADSESTLKLAQDPTRHIVPKAIPFETLNWGCFTMYLSELGKTKQLNSLLSYADERLNPTWQNGGLFYPRNDELADEDWNLTHVEPYSGNSGIAYARLNVAGGQRRMWESPWTREMLTERPWVDGVGYGDGVDFLRAVWDEKVEAMVVTVRRWDGERKEARLVVRNLKEGRWGVYVYGKLVQVEDVEAQGVVEVEVIVGGEEVDIAVQRV